MQTNSKSVVLITTTFSNSVDEMRAQLALRTCKAAQEHGYKMIIVDGSPCPEFKTALRKTGATVIDQKMPGMGASRREAVLAGVASGATVIIWMEPEKYSLIPLLQPCITPVSTGEVDVVITRRKNLDNYPRYQQLSEYRGNWEIGHITGRPDLDLYSGPRVMSVEAARLLADYNGSCGQNTYGDNWEILFVPVLWWLLKGLQVKSVTVNYVHPSEQLVEDDEAMQAKRDKQRNDLGGAMHREAERIGFKSPLAI